MSTVEVHLHQIAYSAQTLASIEPGYTLIDNLQNERPDWFEYWPIRRFLKMQALDESAFYGFFSPKFRSKTGLAHHDVQRIVQAFAPQADVVLFSPQPDMGAFFLNVFEQAETFDQGLMEGFEAFLQSIGRPVQLRSLVMDSRQVVFSNYFVARPVFWRTWLALCESFFDVCEGPATALRDALIRPTSYAGAQRKVFLMERMASLLLATEPAWRSCAANPFPFAWSASRLSEHPIEAAMSDALKIAYREQPFPEYLRAFSHIRDMFLTPRTPRPEAAAQV